MNREQCWAIVESARAQAPGAAGADLVAEQVVVRLAEIGADQAIAFELERERLMSEAHRWDLWAAAYLINRGCSDDGFMDFRGWLMAQGRGVWERALADPDSLADVVDADALDGGVWGEPMLYVASYAHERAAHGSDVDSFWDALELAGASDGEDERDGPAGEEFDFDSTEAMRIRLPRLAGLCLPDRTG